MIEAIEHKEQEFNPQSLGVVTTTHYPLWYKGNINPLKREALVDKVRGDLALETIHSVTINGYQIVVVDSQKSPAFGEELKKLNDIILAEEIPGLSNSRQQGFRKALELTYKEGQKAVPIEIIAWVEPEKVSIVKNNIPIIIKPLLKNKADIVIPKRGMQEFVDTYPDYQVKYEKASNLLWNRMLRIFGIMPQDHEDLDVWFGPRFFSNKPEVTSLFLKKYNYLENSNLQETSNKIYQTDGYSNALYFPVIQALFNHLRVESVEIPYLHPETQTQIENNNDNFKQKRLNQQREIIRTNADFCRMLLKRSSHTSLAK